VPKPSRAAVEAPYLSVEFRHPLRVRYGECDPQGVVFNAHYLAYFDIAMTELWRELGGYEAMVADGIDMVVAEARVRYRAPLRFDDEVELVVRGVRLGNTSMTSELAIERDGQVCVEGELRHVFVDPAKGGTAPMPEAVREGLRTYSV
jgi:acyl-CoA thioester hydrolase